MYSIYTYQRISHRLCAITCSSEKVELTFIIIMPLIIVSFIDKNTKYFRMGKLQQTPCMITSSFHTNWTLPLPDKNRTSCLLFWENALSKLFPTAEAMQHQECQFVFHFWNWTLIMTLGWTLECTVQTCLCLSGFQSSNSLLAVYVIYINSSEQ